MGNVQLMAERFDGFSVLITTNDFLIYFLSTDRGSFAILKAKIIIGRHREMKKILFVCHGSILRSLEKACYINDFHRSNGAYYTTITPFVEEL